MFKSDSLQQKFSGPVIFVIFIIARKSLNWIKTYFDSDIFSDIKNYTYTLCENFVYLVTIDTDGLADVAKDRKNLPGFR